MKTKITHPMIQKASTKQLEQYCRELQIEFAKDKSDVLYTPLHKALESKKVEYPTQFSPYYIRFGNMIHTVMYDKETSYSNKIRALYDLGVKEVKEIVKITGRHYSFVHGVIKKYTMKK